MFCSKCGSKIEEGSNFCSNCRNPVRTPNAAAHKVIKKTIHRSRADVSAGKSVAAKAGNDDLKALGLALTKYKWPLLAVLAIVIVVSVIAKLVESKPDKDANEVLKTQCDCYKDNDAAIARVLQSFKSDFDSKKYKSRAEAYNALNQAKNAAMQALPACLQAAEQKRLKFRARYISQYQKLNIFDNTINANGAGCVRNDNNALEADITQSIGQIKDPTPDIEKIKNDLIGKIIPGWKFDYLSEFQQADIANTTAGNDRIEYQVKMHLVDNGVTGINAEHDCEVMIVYTQGGNGWYFNEMHEMYITYTYTFQVNQWQRIYPLQNCRFTIQDNGKNYWAFDGGYAQKKYMGGPAEPSFSLTTDEVYFMSRESEPVNLTFKYTPVN